MQNKHYAFLF